jgi:hypothetical protein
MSTPTIEWPGRRIGDPAHDRVAAFLTLDIQRDREAALDLASRIDAVRAGALPSWERVGNAYHLRLSPERARIEDVVDGTSRSESVPVDELAAAVTAWIASLR